MAIRSKLFVPGSRPELFAKAFASAADSVSFDLEDSVVASRKDEARRAVAKFLCEGSGTHGKAAIVRVNPLGTDHFQADMECMAVAGVHVINLPKVERAQDVHAAVDLMEAAERKAALAGDTWVLANIETPKGLRCAYEIAAAHPRVMGLQIGFLDMARACGFDTRNQAALNAVRMAVSLAASEAGLAAFDGAYANVKDRDGFRAEAEEARRFGISGKSCIHPSQVALANEVFAPAPDAIAAARRVVSAAAHADNQGAGAFLLDGAMVDYPVIEQAQAVLTRASKFGLLHERSESI